VITIAVVSAVEAIAFAGTYLLFSRHYVTTDNAQVDGDRITISAPESGNLTEWSAVSGSRVRENDVLGRIQVAGGGGQPKRAIRSPGTGTIAVNNATSGQYVSAGTKLATAYDLDALYVTARVDERDVGDVRPGEQVDISADAFPDAHVVGRVDRIQAAAAGEFTIYPNPDTDPTNPQKTTQYIPVRIQIMNSDGVQLLPGMNVLARIRKG
jgi:multidrug resistance efflux pump